MNNIEPSYKAPHATELKELGYYSQWISYEATSEILSYLTSYGNPFNHITTQYLAKHKNIAHPSRMALSVMSYGLDNLSQFGNKYDNVLYQASVRMIRHILAKVSTDKLHTFCTQQFMSLAYQLDSSLTKEAMDINRRLASKQKLENKDFSDSWYVKLQMMSG